MNDGGGEIRYEPGHAQYRFHSHPRIVTSDRECPGVEPEEMGGGEADQNVAREKTARQISSLKQPTLTHSPVRSWISISLLLRNYK